MSDRNSGKAGSRGNARGPLVALGVLWSPAIPKRRRISLRLRLPGQRRIDGNRRRGRRSAQQASPGAESSFAAYIFAAHAASP